MFEMPATQFNRVLPLFDEEQPNSAMVFSTLEGRTPGKAYINVIDNPTACILTINFHNLTFLGGMIEQQWLNEAVAKLRRTQDVNLTWSSQVAQGLKPPSPPVAEIARFEFFDCPTEPSVALPDGHHLQNIDIELFSRCLWRDEVIMACATTENFLRHGFGLCLMTHNEIRSEAYAAFRGAGKFEIGVITHDKYFKQGYAFITCKHLIRICEERGYPTCWSCHQNNVASVATARKLGYKTQKAYKFLYYSRIEQ